MSDPWLDISMAVHANRRTQLERYRRALCVALAVIVLLLAGIAGLLVPIL